MKLNKEKLEKLLNEVIEKQNSDSILLSRPEPKNKVSESNTEGNDQEER